MGSVTTTAAPARRAAGSTLAALGLLGVTAAWGSTFFLLKDVVERVPVSDFLGVRFALAAVAVWLIAPRSVSRLTSQERRHGVLLGLVYGGAQLLQTVGLQTTSASVSGFVTGMYVVFTPLIGAVLLRARSSSAPSRGVNTTYMPVTKPDTDAEVCCRPTVCSS